MSTPFLDEVYEQVDFDRELVFKFFTVFSLFEYALKQQTRFRTFRQGRLKPNWDSFARDIHKRFDQESVRESVDYLLNHPPRKQTLVNGFLDYEETKRDEPNEIVWLSRLIRRVRNNLFHGGKFGYKPERDTPLMIHSLLILEAWAQCDHEVENALCLVR